MKRCCLIDVQTGKAILGLLIASFGYTVFAQESSLIAHYQFAGNATDSSGRQPDGSVIGALLCPDRYDKENGAYSFDGVNDYIDIGSGVKPGFPFTIIVWFRGDGRLFSNDQVDDSSYRYGFLLITDTEDHSLGTYLTFYSGYSSGSSRAHQRPAGFNGFQTARWHFLAVTVYSVSTGDWYIDGKHYPGEIFSNGTGSTMLYGRGSGTIGSTRPTFVQHYKGVIDEIMVFNRALTIRQIEGYYDHATTENCGTCGTYVGGMIANATWTKDKSPYCVTNDVIALGNLVIQEGVEVRMCGSFQFEVQGKLMINGTADERVHFRPADPQVGWQGLVFPNTQPGSYFHYAIIEGSKNSGLRLTNSAPALFNCWIINNYSPESGGGIKAMIGNADDWVLSHCVISNNTANYFGGGMRLDINRNFIAEQCQYVYNEGAGVGGGFAGLLGNKANLQFYNCLWLSNSVIGTPSHGAGGGGFYVSGPMTNQFGHFTYKMNHCQVISNITKGFPGKWNIGAGIDQNGGIGLIRNSIVTDNAVTGSSAVAYGGGIYHQGEQCSMENCVIARNSVKGDGIGGAGIFHKGGELRVVNCTIVENNTHGGISSVPEAYGIVLNSILFNNNQGGAQIGYLTASYSCIQNGWIDGTNNISYAPGLCPENFVLSPASPCIDAGHPGLEYRDACVDNANLCSPCARGTPRNDMGAYGGPGVAGWCEDCPRPVIVRQPRPMWFALPGDQPAWDLETRDPSPVSYQWFKDRLPLDNATNAVLTFATGVSTNEAGHYQVEVWNGQGTVISQPTTLFLTECVVQARLNASRRVELTLRPYQPPRDVAIERATALRSDGTAAWDRLLTTTINGAAEIWTDPNEVASGPHFYRVVPLP